MAGLTDSTRKEKRKLNIYNTMWLRVGVDIEHFNDSSLQKRVEAISSPSKIWVVERLSADIPAKTWKEPNGYLRSSKPLYGLTVYEVQGYDDAKRYHIPGNGMGDENIYYHINGQGKVDTYIRCNNIKHDAAPCEQSFMLPTAKNTMIEVGYRIGLLPQ